MFSRRYDKFTYKYAIKIKNKHVAGVSRTFYLSKEIISRPPQSRETIPIRLSTFLTHLHIRSAVGK
jgi:hypothetical protein